MGPWQFPNAIAESVRLAARRRDQTSDRFVPEDPDWLLPLDLVVRIGQACPRSPMNIHTSFRNREFCDSCGATVEH